MVLAWYMDDDTTVDQRHPHKKSPNDPVELDTLEKLGVLYHKIDGDDFTTNEKLLQIRKERNYSYEDCITCSPDKLPNYEEKIKSFFEEHLHADEEIRLCCEGSGYFDVRDRDDKWIRIELEKGDLIILPAGIYHRFTMDEKNYIQARRYFVGEPVWKAHNRPADDMKDIRQTYLKSLASA